MDRLHGLSSAAALGWHSHPIWACYLPVTAATCYNKNHKDRGKEKHVAAWFSFGEISHKTNVHGLAWTSPIFPSKNVVLDFSKGCSIHPGFWTPHSLNIAEGNCSSKYMNVFWTDLCRFTCCLQPQLFLCLEETERAETNCSCSRSVWHQC